MLFILIFYKTAQYYKIIFVNFLKCNSFFCFSGKWMLHIMMYIAIFDFQKDENKVLKDY